MERAVWQLWFDYVIAISMVIEILFSGASAQDASMVGMRMGHAATELPSPHAGSGTAWEPASVPEHAWMWMENPMSRKSGETWGTQTSGTPDVAARHPK